MVDGNNILLAGGRGIIGSYLYNYLNGNFNIKSIDNQGDDSTDSAINLDLADQKKVNLFVRDCPQYDTLIFLVGLAHKKGKGNDLADFENINYQTLVNLLVALDDNNKIPEKIMLASTISVYGEKLKRQNYDESLQPEPSSPYAVTKLMAENYLLENYKAKSWILRFAPVYSWDFLLNVDRRTKMGGRFYRVGKGFKKLSLCNIENIRAAVEAIINGNVPAGLYNLSDPIEYTYNELLTWRNADGVIRIPVFAVRILYYLGKLFNSTFLKENTVKLISDNVFPSDKIRSYVDLPAVIRVC